MGVIGGIPPTAPPSPPKSSLCVWPRAHITTRNGTSPNARSERLCSAPVATRLSAYVTLLWRPDIRETPLCRIIFSRGLYSSSVPQSPACFNLTFTALMFEKFSVLRAHIFAYILGSHDVPIICIETGGLETDGLIN